MSTTPNATADGTAPSKTAITYLRDAGQPLEKGRIRYSVSILLRLGSLIASVGLARAPGHSGIALL